MGFKDLQLLVLLVWLRLGHTFAESLNNPVPANETAPGQWNVTSATPLVPILQSNSKNYSFDLMLTNLSKDSCAAVVRHVRTKTTVWVANFESSNSSSSNLNQTCWLYFKPDAGLMLTTGSNQSGFWNNSVGLEKGLNILHLDDAGTLNLLHDFQSRPGWNSFGHLSDTLIRAERVPRSDDIRMQAAHLNHMYSAGGNFSMRLNDTSLVLEQTYIANGTEGKNIYYSWPFLEKTTQNKQEDEFWNDLANNSISFISDYAKLEFNGSLVVRNYDGRSHFLFGGGDSNCSLPAACGSFGICSSPGRNCTCPSEGFKQLTTETGHSTCEYLSVPNTCNDSKLINITGSTYWNMTSQGGQFLNRSACESSCSVNCSCNIALHVAANEESQTGSCFFLNSMQTIRQVGDGRDKHTLFLRVSTVDFRLRPDPFSPPAPGSGSSRRTAAIVFAGVAVAFVLLLLGASAWWLLVTRRKIFDDADRGVYDAAVAAGKTSRKQLPPRYTYEQLKVSTGGFRHVFGSPSQSSVYFGTLPNNSDTKIAVKALDERGHKDKDFMATVATMGRLSHPNLVPLLGYCKEGRHKMLVYELVNEGKSLSWLLFNAGAPTLDASTRRLIALGTAQGLQHLGHNGVRHGGVKPENILIDTQRRPKLVDYGLLELWSAQTAALPFEDLRGARGYKAPESLQEGPLTEEADVYSLGVVILELVSGRRCLVPEAVPEEGRYLPAWGFALLRRHNNDLDSALELADPRLDAHALSETDQQVLKGMVFVALCCVQADPALRPSMDEVVRMLEGGRTVNAPPTSPALDDYADKLCSATQQPGFVHSPSVSENSDMRPR